MRFIRNAIFEDATKALFPITAGDYVCCSWICLKDLINELEFFTYDPLSHVIEAMDESSILQVIFQAYKQEVNLPYFKALVRLAVISSNPFRSRQVIESISNSFSAISQFFKPKLISFPILVNSFLILKLIAKRKFPRFYSLEKLKTFVLPLPQLSTLVHLPVGIESPKVSYSAARQLLAPQQTDDIAIGYVKFRGKPIEEAKLRSSDLTRHTYILGASGTGKTSLLINLISQVQRKGYCVHVIDPHGDMAYDLIESLSDEQLSNAIILDPLKVKFSINPFELPRYSNSYEREMAVERIIGQIVELMKRIFGSRYWGPSLNRTFQNTIRLLYKRDDKPTFEDILNVITGKVEEDFSKTKEFIEFQKELKLVPGERLDAVINKVDPFVKNSLLRIIFCAKESKINFEEFLESGKIVIWRLAKAELSEQNMQMIGSAIITKFWFQCASRPREDRNPVLLVIDEFQNFEFLETLRIMITEARKFGVGLILSHQHTKQLSQETLSEVLGNTATKIIFKSLGMMHSLFQEV